MSDQKEKKNYELITIIAGSKSEKEAAEDLDKIRKILADYGATIITEQNWDKKLLAYGIEKETHGYYHFIKFEAAPSAIAEINNLLSLSEWLLRYLISNEVTEKRNSKGKGKAGKKPPLDGAEDKEGLAEPEQEEAEKTPIELPAEKTENLPTELEDAIDEILEVPKSKEKREEKEKPKDEDGEDKSELDKKLDEILKG